MKDFNICPKCNSQDILRLTDKTHANMIPLNMILGQVVYLTRFVCANCGYCEQWVESREDREKLRKYHQPITRPIVRL